MNEGAELKHGVTCLRSRQIENSLMINISCGIVIFAQFTILEMQMIFFLGAILLVLFEILNAVHKIAAVCAAWIYIWKRFLFVKVQVWRF